MSQLIQLRRKIKSITTTKKITYAMRLTSMSLYSRLEKKNIALKNYKDQVSNIFQYVYNSAPTWNNDVLKPKDILNSKPLIIIVASSKGLCGGFNSNLIKFYDQDFISEEHQQPSFITVGQKAFNFAINKNIKPIKSFNDFNSNNYNYIADDLLEIINKEKFSSVVFYSNIFKSFFAQRPTKTQVIPLNEEIVSSTDNKNEPILEQDLPEVMEFLSDRYLKSSILYLLFQSILSEQASRFLAMDASTTNANKLIDTLTLKYNKARQALITKELAELTASFGSSN